MTEAEAGKHWAKMHEEWHIAQQAGREATHACTQAFIACAAGKSTGPTTAQMDRAQELTYRADGLRLQLDDFLRKHFG